MATILTRETATLSRAPINGSDRVQPKKARSQWLACALLPSATDMFFVMLLALLVSLGSRFISSDGDAARHLTVGEYMLASRSALRADVFSFTMLGQPFVPYEWLAEVASAASYRLLGLAGPVLLHGAVIALTMSLVFARLLRRGGSPLLALGVIVLAAATSKVHWLARPHVFTFLGTAIFCLVLDEWRAGHLSRKWLWVLPPTMALWANLHGGFLVGLLLVATYIGADVLRWLFGLPKSAAVPARAVRDLVPVALATLVATCVNPVGPGLLAHVVGWLGDTLLINVTQEYKSPNFHDATLRTFAAMLILIIASVAWSRRRPALHEGLLVLGFAYLSFFSQRNIPLFAIVTAPILMRQLAGLPLSFGRFNMATSRITSWVGRRDRVFALMNARARGHFWPLAVVVGLAAIAVLQQRDADAPLGIRFDPARQPVAAVEYLKAHPLPGNMFNDLHWGGYILHELWPTQRVFIDGQTDFYGDGLTQEYIDVIDVKPNWREVLNRHDVQWIIYPSDSSLEQILIASGDWDSVYRDSVAVVFRRRSP